MLMTPLPVTVADRATTSSTGGGEAERSRVLRPEKIGAGDALLQEKLNCMSVGPKAALGTNAITKLCEAPAGMFTGAFGDPVGWLVAGLVV